MRFTKFLTLALATAAFATAGATADPGHGAKPEHGPKACHGKAQVSVNLKGTFVAAAADGTSFTMNATKANKHGRAYLKAAQPLTVAVDAKTRFVKADALAKLTDLAANDRLVVKARAAKCDLAKATSPDALPALTARMVVDQGAAQASSETEK
jgi:hypothetical protein